MAHPLSLLDNLHLKTVAEQIADYRKLQLDLEATRRVSPQILDDLFELQSKLATADRALQVNYACREASDLYRQAFRIDPHNQSLYHLAELMLDLNRVAQEDPNNWETESDRLIQEPAYAFEAAQTYLKKANRRITSAVLEVVQQIRAGLLDSSRDRLAEIEATWPQRPFAIQAVRSISDAYWHLYDYARQNTDVITRLDQAETALEDAQASIGQLASPPPELKEELTVLGALLRVYQFISQTSAQEFEGAKQQLNLLSDMGEHAFIKRAHRELESLTNWKQRAEKVLDLCLRHDYGAAGDALKEMTVFHKEALKWLASVIVPDLGRWEQFCQNARHGVEAWQRHAYPQTFSHFSTAADQLPTDLTGRIPAGMQADFEQLVQDLNLLQLNLDSNRALLLEATHFDGFKPLADSLLQAQQIEARYQPVFGGASFISGMVQRAQRFLSATEVGDPERLNDILQEAQSVEDPLLPGYERIINTIHQGLQPGKLGMLQEQINLALRLAPESAELKTRRKEIVKLSQAVENILADIRAKRLTEAWEQLERWEEEYEVLPPAITCLWHICAGYDFLAGNAGQDLPAGKRVEQATHFAGEANQVYTREALTPLGQEISILTTLTQTYQALSSQGMGYLESAQARLARLLQDGVASSDHAFVAEIKNRLASLVSWQGKQLRFFDDLSHYRFEEAFQTLQQLTGVEKQSLVWLDETINPDWESWETFCLEAQQGLAFAQKRNYKQARTQLALASRKIPTDFPADHKRLLPGQLNSMVRDLVTLETRLQDAQRLLEIPSDDRVYLQVSQSLSEASQIEQRYFPQFVEEATSITTLRVRYQQFEQAAKKAELARLQTIIDEARLTADPLTPGYQSVQTVISEGFSSDASPEQVEAAWKLAPESNDLFIKIDQVDTAEYITLTLQHLHAGALDRAGGILEQARQMRPNSKQLQCLVKILSGYEFLFNPADQTVPLTVRLGHALEAIESTELCYDARLIQERTILQALIAGYRDFQPDGQIVGQALRTLMEAKEGVAAHYFVDQFSTEVSGVKALQGRQHRVQDEWLRQRYQQAWAELKNLSEAEKQAISRLGDEAQADWKTWRTFGEATFQGVTLWRNYDYAAARNQFVKARSSLPANVQTLTQTTITGQLDELVVELEMIQGHVDQVVSLLNQFDSTHYDTIAEELQLTQEIEAKYADRIDFGGTGQSPVMERFQGFRQSVIIGDLEQLNQLTGEGAAANDPLSAAYETICHTIREAKGSRATGKQILAAAKLAPQDTTLKKRRRKMQQKGGIIWAALSLLIIALIAGIIITYLRSAVTSEVESGALTPAAVTTLPPETPSPEPTSTLMAVVGVTNTLTPTLAVVPTATEAAPTPVPPTNTPEPAPVNQLVRGPGEDVLRAARWDSRLTYVADQASIYYTQEGQWQIKTVAGPHEFWILDDHAAPLEFTASMFIVNKTQVTDQGPTPIPYGLVIVERDRGDVFSFQLQEQAEGQWGFTVTQGLEPIASGISQTPGRIGPSFNQVAVRVTDAGLDFIINETEVVFTQPYADALTSNWRLGVAAGPNARAVLGEVQIYPLTN